MILTDVEKKMRDGDMGDAVAMAIAILIDLGQAIDAPRLIEISHVHTDSGFYLGDAGLEFVEHLASLNARVAVPTSMNNTSFDIEKGQSYGVSPELAAKIKRLEKAHLKIGAQPTWTCAPYQDGVLPQKGDRVAWSESNAIVFANSVLGARTNRTGDLVDICCALTGRVPESGLYLDENRKADIHIQLKGFKDDILLDPRLYPLLGYCVGNRCGNRVFAISGIPKQVTKDDLKGLGAATASSGATALFHVVGVTPEASTLEACINSNSGAEAMVLTPDDIQAAEELLLTATDDQLDWVGFGCPHFSLDEFTYLAKTLENQHIHQNVTCTVFTSRKTLKRAKQSGIVDKLTQAGIKIFVDGCLLLYPQQMKPPGTMMTNSAKAANYVFSQSGYKVVYGSIDECIQSAVAGKILPRRQV